MAVILTTLAIIAGTLIIGDLLRHYVIYPLTCSSWIKTLLVDAILTFELCGTSFEMGVIYQHYGLGLWTVGLFASCIYQLWRWKGLPMPSTHTQVTHWLQGQQSAAFTLVRCLLYLLTGLATYHYYNVIIWNMKWSDLHHGRDYETASGVCVSPWEQVSRGQSFMAEFLGTMLLVIITTNLVDFYYQTSSIINS